MRLLSVTAAVLAGALPAAPAAGQACSGTPLEGRPVALSAALARADGWSAWSAAVDVRPAGRGGPLAPLVLSASGAVYDYEGSTVDLREVAAGAAWEIPAGPLSVCPKAAGAYAWPDDDRYSIDAWTGAAGAAVGIARDVGPVRAIGFADAGVAVTRAAIGGASDTSTDGIWTVGATVSGSRLFGTVSVEATTAEGVDPALGVAAGVLLP